MLRSTLLLSSIFFAASPLQTRAQGLDQLQAAIDRGLVAPPPQAAPTPGAPAPRVNEELFYKVDESGGLRAINFALALPREGQIVSNTPSIRVPGRFGTALAAGTTTPSATNNRIESGWAPGQITGSDLTWAAFLRVGNSHPAVSLTYVFGIPTALQFRVFTGTTTLVTSSWTTSAPVLRTVANVYGMASAGWVHVALVIDTSRSTATYYINGVAETPIAIAGGFTANVTALNVGQQLPTLAASIYEIDDFRLLTRAASPAEVASWASASTAADAAYGAGCGATLSSSNGPPTLGNATYSLDVSGPSGAVGALAIGALRHDLLGIPLPFDLGLLFPSLPGCNWESSADVFVPIALPSGSASVPLGIPNNVSLQHASLYTQALVFTTSPSSSNPFAVSIEP